jgi:hypothetical protein
MCAVVPAQELLRWETELPAEQMGCSRCDFGRTVRDERGEA